MASSLPEPDDLEWTEETYTVSELVNHFDLPRVVKVAEGIYSAEDSESFSTGDFLKLHRYERIDKVIAYPMEAGFTATALQTYKTLSSPILIPLDYRRRARVLLTQAPGTRYQRVEDLLKDFPRYVEVGRREIYGRHLQTGEVLKIPAKSPLELLRTTRDASTKSTTLICRHGGKELELDVDCRGDFSPVQDPAAYTFRDIVNSFRLPQLVELPINVIKKEKLLTGEVKTALANLGNFQGVFILDRVDCEYKVLGTHRMDLHYQEDSAAVENYKRHQAVVIIPFSSDAVFQVAINRNAKLYDTVISLNFKSELSAISLDGLYMEVQGSNKSQTVETDYDYPDVAELLGRGNTPPDPNRKSKPKRVGVSGMSACSQISATSAKSPPSRPLKNYKPMSPIRKPLPPPNRAKRQPASPTDARQPTAPTKNRLLAPPTEKQQENRPVKTTQSTTPIGKQQPTSPTDRRLIEPPTERRQPILPTGRRQQTPPTDSRLPISPTEKQQPTSPAEIGQPTLPTEKPQPTSSREKGQPTSPTEKRQPIETQPQRTHTKDSQSAVPAENQKSTVHTEGRQPTQDKRTSFPPPVARKPETTKPSLAVSPLTQGDTTNVDTSEYLNPTSQVPQQEQERNQSLDRSTSALKQIGQEESPWCSVLKSYSVKQVLQSLEELGFGEKVETFQQMNIDGEYLLAMCSADEQVLQQEPFHLNLCDILKLKLFVQKGKLPFRDKAELNLGAL